MEENSKNNKVIKFFVVILIIAILGFAGYICYDKVLSPNNGTNKNNNEQKEKDKQTDEKEEDITDQSLINDLSKKVSILNIYGGNSTLKSVSNDNYSTDYLTSKSLTILAYESNDSKGNNIYSTILDEKSKLRMVLMNAVEYSEVSIPEKDVQIKEKIGYKALKGQVSASDVEAAYFNLFGEKLVNHASIIVDNNICPGFYYDEVNKVYFGVPECGGTSFATFLLYKNKFSKKANEAYVYVNIGNTDINKRTVYDDYVSVDNQTVIEKKISKDYKIDESNHTKFTEYKYTFAKDTTGNYYFSKVEKVNKK